jgi:hypothetical protein
MVSARDSAPARASTAVAQSRTASIAGAPGWLSRLHRPDRLEQGQQIRSPETARVTIAEPE